MIYTATGHRPDKLGGYDQKSTRRLQGFAVDTLDKFGPTKMIVGMALGWDMAVAWACVKLSIPFVAAVPFYGQERLWPIETQALYHELLLEAAEFIVITKGGYAPWKMLRRNRWMVNQCDEILALYDGSPHGGTASCVEYAIGKGKKINNVWDDWKELQ